MADEARRPEEVAEAVVAEAPDQAWLRELIGELERRLHSAEIEWVRAVWGLETEELATAFGVNTETFAKWARAGVPDEHRADLAEIVAATDRLLAYLRRERIPAAVRRESEALDGRSLVGLVTAGCLRETREAVDEMFDLRSTQP